MANSRFCFSESIQPRQRLHADPRLAGSVCAALLLMQLPRLWLLAWLLLLLWLLLL
jgi:hypothetical protein